VKGEAEKAESMKDRRRAFLLLFILCLSVCLGAVTGCTRKPAQKRPIEIALHVWPGYGLAYLAQQKGFFQKNNVEVKLLMKKSAPESLESFTNGEVEGCFDVFADMIMLSARGIPAKVVCIIDCSDTCDVIVGRTEVESLAGLKGKTISFEGINTFSHIFVLNALEKVGLTESDVRFENVAAHDVLVALEERRIDAGHTWEPTKSQALKKGYKILAKAGDFPGLITDVLAFTPTIIMERPDEIRAVVKSLFEARDYLRDNWDEAVAIMAEKMGMAKEEMAAGLEGVLQPDLEENVGFLLAPSASLYDSGNTIMHFYLSRGQLSRVLDVKEVIEPRFVEELAKK
jgi:NitT/TauT family transport system substrate-binding protein